MTNSHKSITESAAELFDQQFQAVVTRGNRVFAGLMLLQYIGCVVAAVFWTPLSWEGRESSIHLHVWASVFLGALIALPPAMMGWLKPENNSLRYLMAIAQMLMSALLIHIGGGRIEMHFHVFGSLAFLAMYRDWRVLLLATAVAAVDHLVRAAFFPMSIFGVDYISIFRALEHAGWVVFEVSVLTVMSRHAIAEMRIAARHQAELRFERNEARKAELGRLSRVVEAAVGVAVGVRSQARSIQDIHASVESFVNLVAGIRRCTLAVQDAVDQVKKLAETGSNAVYCADASMVQIQKSSQQVTESLAEIQDIADQTNLLSLNAAIEAARAGALGKGFSVVATEVKELACRSNRTAQSIVSLVADSSQRIEVGVATSKETTQVLNEILNSVDSVCHQLADIADVAQKQLQKAQDVSQAVSTVNKLASQTDVGIRDIVARCEELPDQSVEMQQLLRNFHEHANLAS